MDPTRFIARRLRFRGGLATAAVAISFLVMIIAVAISSGFRQAVRDGVSAVTGDVQVTPVDMDYVGEDQPVPVSLGTELRTLPGVRSVTPAVYRAGIVKHGDIIHGVLVKGVPGADSTLSVSIPSRLAEITGLGPGDDMLTYFVGERVKVRKFHVRDVYRSALELNDNLIVQARLADMQRLNGWSEDDASTLELALSGTARDHPERITDAVNARLFLSADETGQSLRATSARSRYPQLFDWLGLLDLNVLIILVLMTLVAGFNMISGLLILLFRHIATIGTLKTLGMTDRAIAVTFLRTASVLVLRGLVLGNGLALLFCLVQGTTHLIRLDPANYFVSYVPVHVNLPAILAADAAAFAAIMVLLTLPCLFISRVDPADTVRVR